VIESGQADQKISIIAESRWSSMIVQMSHMRKAINKLSVAALMVRICVFSTGAAQGERFFHDDPDHLWNRLNAALFLRTAEDGKSYGLHELDILYSHNTKHLLSGEDHERAIAALNEFEKQHGERLIADPIKRALLQRRLWALFDWAANDNANDLPSRLARVIRAVALTTNEIVALPNNYAQAVKEG
jgi:hypothetical protein